MINGFTSVNLTKLDVLTGLAELKLGVRYIVDGKKLNIGEMPSSISHLARVEVEYETMPGWVDDISASRSMEELPENAKRYVLRISELLSVPVSYIGVGPGRNDMIANN